MRAFGAEEVMRLPGPGGKLAHAAIRIGDSMVMLMDEFPDWDANGPGTLGGTPVTIHLAVPAVDDWFERAVEAGAVARMAPADMFWGDRYGVVEDPFGHRWSMATHLRDVSPKRWRARWRRAWAGSRKTHGRQQDPALRIMMADPQPGQGTS